MRIAFLTAYYPPEITADTHLEQDILEGMSKKGWEVFVFTSTPTRGVDKNTIKEYKKINKEIQYDGHVKITRFWAPQEKNSSILRAFRYSWCCLRQFQLAKRIGYVDVIYCNSTPPIVGLVAAKLKKVYKCKFVYSLQDLFPESLYTAGITSEKSLWMTIGNKIANYVYCASDHIITLNDNLKNILITKGQDVEKITTVNNWIDVSSIGRIEKKNNRIFDEYNIDRDKFTVVYAGNFGKSQNIDYIVEAANKLSLHNEIQFILFGAGSEYNRICDKVKGMQLNNIHVFPILPSERISEVYSLGDVSIICNAPGISSVAMPSKTWTIMGTGTPIIAVSDQSCELSELIKTIECGYIADPLDVSGFVEIIISCSKLTENELFKMGANGRAYVVKNRNKEDLVKKYLNIIRKA